MRAIIVHTSDERSLAAARKTAESFNGFTSWDPEFLAGVEPATLPEWLEELPFPLQQGSRLSRFKSGKPRAFPFKRSCAINHYRFYRMVVNHGKTMAFVEHDSQCLREWEGEDFAGVLALNAVSSRNAMRRQHGRRGQRGPRKLPKGVHDWTEPFCRCHHHHKSGFHILGTAAYAVTPAAALKLIHVIENMGWEQSDIQVNTNHVPVQYVNPEYFSFHSPNLKTSHGE